MSFIEYRNLLTTIGRSLEELDRTYLLYLFEGKIQAGNEHNIQNVLTLFKEMEANNTLGIDRLENVKELLIVLKKWHLFKDVGTFEDKRKKYNDLLQQISEALDESIEMERLILICRGKILEEREGSITNTRSLFRELETQNNLEFSRLNILKEVLNSVQREDLLRKVEEFERWRNDGDESARRGGERAIMFAHARLLGGRVLGGLNMKTICQVGAAGITLLTVHELLKRSDTYEQLMASFTACVLPAGTQLIDITQGCVCFTIKADNLAALCTLWNMYQDGTLKLRVKNFVLTEEMIKLAGGEENMEVTVTIEENEYEKACFEFIREQEGAKPCKTIRRNSDSALAALPYEDEVSLVKMKQLENAFKLQQERIASVEKEVEILPELFLQMESPQTAIEKGKGLKPRKTLRRDRGSDFELTDKDEDDEDEDEVSLAKIKQLENAFKLQQERIASLEKEAEMLPELLFQMESLQTAIEKGKVDVDKAEEIKRMNVLTAKLNLTSIRDIRKEKLRYRPRGKAFHLTAGFASDIKRGSQHFDVADDCIKLAAVHREIGDVDKAQRYETLAFDIRDKRLGFQHPDVAAVYDELAAVYRNRGDLDGAKFYLKLALDSKGKKLGFQHPDVAAVYVELAAVYRKRGDLDRAKGYVMLALDIREKKLGSQHLDVAAAYDELAAVYRTRGDLDEAKWYLRRARDIRGEKIWAPVSTAMS